MLIVTPTQMRELDECAIYQKGIGGIVLMERAGRGVAETVHQIFEEKENVKVAVISGTGNNGGDGLVAARYLAGWGYQVKVFLNGDIGQLKNDAHLNFERLSEQNIVWKQISRVPRLEKFDVIIDALMGTGFRGQPRGKLPKLINAINKQDAFVVAVDIPTGVNGETGEVYKELAVEADVTVTFGLPKLGLFQWPGRGYVNHLRVIDIGIPNSCVNEEQIDYQTNDPLELEQLLPQRPGDGHKGTFGKGIMVSGGLSYTGAPTLVCNSFFRSGAGYCTLLCPRSLYPILSVKLTETVIRPVAEVRKKQVISLRALGEILQWAKKGDALVIGPGLGRYRETVEMVQRLVTKPGLPPMLIDGDGLYALSKKEGLFDQITSPFILTPHLGELARLLDKSIQEVAEKRFTEAREWANYFGGVLVIKGNPTLVASPEYPRIIVNATGNDGMAKAGSGDVLAGLIGGLLAQGVNPFNAARLGVYIHGLAGDRAADFMGHRSIMPTDISQFIPRVIRELEKKKLLLDWLF